MARCGLGLAFAAGPAYAYPGSRCCDPAPPPAACSSSNCPSHAPWLLVAAGWLLAVVCGLLPDLHPLRQQQISLSWPLHPPAALCRTFCSLMSSLWQARRCIWVT